MKMKNNIFPIANSLSRILFFLIAFFWIFTPSFNAYATEDCDKLIEPSRKRDLCELRHQGYIISDIPGECISLTGDALRQCIDDITPQPTAGTSDEQKVFDIFGRIENPLPGSYGQTNGLSAFLNNIITLIFIIAGILVLFFLIFGGIKWIMSGGDQKKTEEARNMIMAAIVGITIVALAWLVILVLEQSFGISITSGVIPSP